MSRNLNSRRSAAGRIGLVVAAWTLGAALMPALSQAGGPVEYVRICEDYPSDFYYLPGTEWCHNPSTNEARQQTAGGTWSWRIPTSPIEWIQAPRKICRGGRLIEFGSLDSSDFVINAHGRPETATPVPLTLGDREYVSSVIYKGDLTGAGADFCLFYHYVDMVDGPYYRALGCASPGSNSRQAALLSYSPDVQPPDTTNPLFLVAASGRQTIPDTVFLGGSLEIWVCVKKTKAGM
jgi:hypothetical protein